MSIIDLSILDRLIHSIDELNRNLSEREVERVIFTTEQAAEFLQVSTPFLQTETRAGRVERVKFGDNPNSPVRYTRDALLDYVKANSGRVQV